MRIIKVFLLLLINLMMCCCFSQKTKTNNKNSELKRDTTSILSETESHFDNNTKSSSTFQKDLPKDEIAVRLKAWNEMHNTYNPDMADDVYAPTVLYYWSDYSPERIKTSKASLFAQNPEFQQALSNILLRYLDCNRIRADFTKSVKIYPSDEAKEYESYLVFEKISREWKVVEESDLTTDKNMKKRVLKGLSKLDEKDHLSLYSKVEKKATGDDDEECLSLFLFNDNTKKKQFLFTTSFDDSEATKIRVLEDGEVITIPTLGEAKIVSDDKVLVTTDELPYSSVYLFDLTKKGCIVFPQSYGGVGLTTYKGVPAIVIGGSYLKDGGGRVIYDIYCDWEGNKLGEGEHVDLQ